MNRNREKAIASVCTFGALTNLVLFFTKLYVSLSANSISIFSDAINNLSDSLSCVLAVVCMLCAAGFVKKGISYLAPKIEQVLSFILAIVVLIIGLSFAYSSLERFMYPAPVWFSVKYFAVISVTALVKLAMFFVYKVFSKKTGSPIIKVMATDSITDFAVTVVTLISFTMTQFTEYTVDAFAGLVISVIIVAGAVKLIKTNLLAVLGVIKKEKREEFIQSAKEIAGENVLDVSFRVDGEDDITGFVRLHLKNEDDFRKQAKEISLNCFEKTGIKAEVIIVSDGDSA